MPRRKRYLKIIWGRFLFIRCDFASLSEGLFVYPSARHTLVESIGNAMFGHYFDKSASVTWNSAIWESIQRQVHQQIKWAHLISEHLQTCFSPLPTFFFSFSPFSFFFSSLFCGRAQLCRSESRKSILWPWSHLQTITSLFLLPISSPLTYVFVFQSPEPGLFQMRLYCTCCVLPSVRRSVRPSTPCHFRKKFK